MDLDCVSIEKLVIIIYILGYLSVVNSKVLVMVGIDENLENFNGGLICCMVNL